MQDLANALSIIVLGAFILIAIEFTYSWYKGNLNYRLMDTISSLSAGMTNAVKTALGLTVVIVGYKYMFEHWRISTLDIKWYTYVVGLVALDFATYWYHRLAHSVNIFWNRHVIHHSGEEFNNAAALRQSVSKFVNISVFFLLPAALLGVPPKVIAIITPFHLFVQIWYHTIHVGKLGWLEYIIVTPSQHRVHHAINDIYLDKNLSPVFCIWDRLFGTFQEELDEEPCVFGVKRQVNSWNPIRINLDHLILLGKDALRADALVDKAKIWFMPTGWRPPDVAEMHPVSITDSKSFVKYDPDVSSELKYWSSIQFVFLLFMVFHLLLNLSSIGIPGIYLYGIFIFGAVYAFTSLMDKDGNALWFESLKSFIGLLIIIRTGSWFGIDESIPGASILVTAYLLISILVVWYFVWIEFKKESLQLDSSMK